MSLASIITFHHFQSFDNLVSDTKTKNFHITCVSKKIWERKLKKNGFSLIISEVTQDLKLILKLVLYIK